MSFISNALGVNNGYQATSGAGPNAPAQQQTDINNLNTTYGAQTNLANMLNAQANGQGPNIANLQLQQATNQNNQQAAAGIASQRGMNPALAQRIISQQQAMNNQNAAGQSGVLRAQQQLAAQQGLANIYGQQAGETNQNLGMLTQAQSSANNANAQIAQNNSNQNAGIAGGILGGAGAALSGIFAKGGEVKHLEHLSMPIGKMVHPLHLALGGLGSTPMNAIDPSLAQGAPPIFGGQSSGASPTANPMAGATNLQKSKDTEFGGSLLGESSPLATGVLAAAHGGLVDAMISPGERVIPPHLVEAVRNGKKKASEVAPKVPGKAKTKGDSEKNDIVPAKLAQGSVVIKRTKADNDEDAREFLQAIKADKEKKSGPSGYARVLQAKRKV